MLLITSEFRVKKAGQQFYPSSQCYIIRPFAIWSLLLKILCVGPKLAFTALLKLTQMKINLAWGIFEKSNKHYLRVWNHHKTEN